MCHIDATAVSSWMTVSYTICNRAPGMSARHHALNDLIARSFASSGVPVTKEPSGLFRTDRKRPDGLTLVPWQSGKSMCWDVTVICPLAESYVNGAAIEASAAAKVAASRKEAKYADINSRYVFEPIDVETLSVFNSSACLLLNELGKRISANSSETRETNFCSNVPQCWCSGLMLFRCVTLCRLLTARTELSYPHCLL